MPLISSVSEKSLIVQLYKCPVSNTVTDDEKQKTLFHGGHALYHEGLKMRSQISQYILP